MVFNIQKIIEKMAITSPVITEKKNLAEICAHYVPGIHINNIDFQKGVLRFKNISPLQRMHLRRYTQDIIKKSSEKKIYLRDIM